MTLNTEQIIKKSIEIHKDTYDYSLVNYINGEIKIKIICKKHGIFEQLPYVHFNGHGCKKCFHERRGDITRLTIEEFIEKGNKFHKNKYDYSKFKYIDNKTAGIIICPIHGEFKQIPTHHYKSGCAKCGRQSSTEKTKMSKDEFIARSIKIHGDRYDYSLFEYKNIDTKGILICKKHGEFLKTPWYHFGGSGCQKCSSSYGEQKIARILEKYKLKYTPQKRFDTCRLIRTLPYDFYCDQLPLLIEYDGIQHFEAVKCHGGQIEYNRLKKADNIKNKWAHDNNIALIRISYLDRDNIEKIILKSIKDLFNINLDKDQLNTINNVIQEK